MPGRGKVRQGGAGCAREGQGGALWFKPLSATPLWRVRQGEAGRRRVRLCGTNLLISDSFEEGTIFKIL